MPVNVIVYQIQNRLSLPVRDGIWACSNMGLDVLKTAFSGAGGGGVGGFGFNQGQETMNARWHPRVNWVPWLKIT